MGQLDVVFVGSLKLDLWSEFSENVACNGFTPIIAIGVHVVLVYCRSKGSTGSKVGHLITDSGFVLGSFARGRQ